MTPEEHTACRSLRLDNSNEKESSNNNNASTYEERLTSYAEANLNNNYNYGNCNFILGSAAEVERLWSVADRIIDGNRSSTSPLLMEAILFLKKTEGFGIYK